LFLELLIGHIGKIQYSRKTSKRFVAVQRGGQTARILKRLDTGNGDRVGKMRQHVLSLMRSYYDDSVCDHLYCSKSTRRLAKHFRNMEVFKVDAMTRAVTDHVMDPIISLDTSGEVANETAFIQLFRTPTKSLMKEAYYRTWQTMLTTPDLMAGTEEEYRRMIMEEWLNGEWVIAIHSEIRFWANSGSFRTLPVLPHVDEEDYVDAPEEKAPPHDMMAVAHREVIVIDDDDPTPISSRTRAKRSDKTWNLPRYAILKILVASMDGNPDWEVIKARLPEEMAEFTAVELAAGYHALCHERIILKGNVSRYILNHRDELKKCLGLK